MLGSNGPPQGQPKQGFRIEWLDGALSTELYPGAQLETIRLFTRLVEHLAAPALSSAMQAGSQAATTTQTTDATPCVRADAADEGQRTSSPPDTQTPSPTTSGDQGDKPEWLSEAIPRWRAGGGVTFSGEHLELFICLKLPPVRRTAG